MATRKPHKADLTAIYRLEFYKNQKNWKLSTDAKKKLLRNSLLTAPIKNTNILNETYSLEVYGDNDHNVLNNAFLKDDSDKDPPVSPTIQRSLQTQLLHPINACCECQHTVAKPQNPWADYVDDDWNIGPHVVDKCSGDQNEFEGFDGWREGMVWTNSAFSQPGWTGDVPAPTSVIQDAQCPGQLHFVSDNLLHHVDNPLLWPDDQMQVPEIWGEHELLIQSLESVDAFMIGAHNAPHSSEVELSVPSESELNLSQGTLSRMSGAALSLAVRRHTSLLKTLLREAGLRQKHRSTLSLDTCAPDHLGIVPRDFFSSHAYSTDYSYEAFPTRDISPTPFRPMIHCNEDFTSLPPTNQCREVFTSLYPANQWRNAFTPLPPANFDRDRFLAGSHINRLALNFVGRGRGRLPKDKGVEV